METTTREDGGFAKVLKQQTGQPFTSFGLNVAGQSWLVPKLVIVGAFIPAISPWFMVHITIVFLGLYGTYMYI